MSALEHKHSELRHSLEDPLVEILAKMIRSALEWESDPQPESDLDSGLNLESTGIDYRPNDPQPLPIA